MRERARVRPSTASTWSSDSSHSAVSSGSMSGSCVVSPSKFIATDSRCDARSEPGQAAGLLPLGPVLLLADRLVVVAAPPHDAPGVADHLRVAAEEDPAATRLHPQGVGVLAQDVLDTTGLSLPFG